MTENAWKQLLAGAPWFRGDGSYPIQAYSEFMPPPRLGLKPYQDPKQAPEHDDGWGWEVTEYEDAFEIKPGLAHLGSMLLTSLRKLGQGNPAHGIARNKLIDNPFWPAVLAEHAGRLAHEHYVALMPLALSRTQDDKGRIRWTLFGASEQGPARPFWQGFYDAPGHERPAEQGWTFFSRLLRTVYGVTAPGEGGLYDAGFRIWPDEAVSSPPSPPTPLPPTGGEGRQADVLPQDEGSSFLPSPSGRGVGGEGEFPTPHLSPVPGFLPSWTHAFLWQPSKGLEGVRYLLTFRPFASFPAELQGAYLSGRLHLIPFPGSLFFWGTNYRLLQGALPLAHQIPLLMSVSRHEGPFGLRVPQAGWHHEPRPDLPSPSGRRAGAEGDPTHYGPLRSRFKRTHRWSRVLRDEDELAIEARDEPLMHVLFSTDPDDMGLYGKPMARNVQVWTHNYDLVLDGPHAGREAIKHAEHRMLGGGLFGYRFQYPAMRVGQHEIYWHRPLAAFFAPHQDEPALLPDAPLGYLTAYPAAAPDPAKPIPLWPRLLSRPAHQAAIDQFRHLNDPRPHMTSRNIRKVLDTASALGGTIDASLARRLVNLPKQQTLDQWIASLPDRALDRAAGEQLAQTLTDCLLPSPSGRGAGGKGAAPHASQSRRAGGEGEQTTPHASRSTPQAALTFSKTATRRFEIAYWKTISRLASGRLRNKDNADCIQDSITQSLVRRHQRDLESLGDYLLDYYTRLAGQSRLTGRALVGELPFRWQTEFDFPWMGGWKLNQEAAARERDIVMVIPGRNRKEVVIMADHYDTAYMENVYDGRNGKKGARLAAAGADDNHSATAALMLGAPVFLALARAGKLDCDIWLVHLTGEEFPSDCMGARWLAQQAVQGSLHLHARDKTEHDLSSTRIRGVYVLDMIAHNNDRAKNIFQITPGVGRDSLWLAQQAHQAATAWNAGAERWNKSPARRDAGPGRRSPNGKTLPHIAKYPTLFDEVRLPIDPRSTLYNTDGQIFSDAGIPVVLFMENYDINRQGYHDTHDTMENIDLDYGSAVAAIAIESVARAATEKPGSSDAPSPPTGKRPRTRTKS